MFPLHPESSLLEVLNRSVDLQDAISQMLEAASRPRTPGKLMSLSSLLKWTLTNMNQGKEKLKYFYVMTCTVFGITCRAKMFGANNTQPIYQPISPLEGQGIKSSKLVCTRLKVE